MTMHQTIEYDKNLPAKIRLRDEPVDRVRGKPHWHEEPQLLYVDSGSVQVTVGAQRHHLGSGDALIVISGEIHSLRSGGAVILSVHFSHAFVRRFEPSGENSDYALEKSSQAYREMTVLLQKLLAIERDNHDEYSTLMKYSLLMKLLRLMLTRCRRQKQFSVYGAGRSERGDAMAVKHYIEVNYRRKIMIAELAELTGCKTGSFTPYFKKLTGKRFTDYVQEVRTRHALEDYLAHDIPVGEAALRNGFCHYNHFTKACHKYYGASPTELKKQRGKAVSLPLEIPA
ncbi:MAG: helix-turn-helix transcriptional regulator [Ruminococcus sp.]|nr:helix-turn-helix transcriptional regulator [Ruminococcus sp.]